jgi:hypothetical protein
MANMLLWATLFVFATSLFQFSYSYGGLARTFAGIDVVFMQEGVATAYRNEKAPSPYFVEELVIELVGTRFSHDLPDYLLGSSYSFSCVFGNYLVKNRTLKMWPTKVTISLSSLSPLMTYADRKSFAIVNGDAYGG